MALILKVWEIIHFIPFPEHCFFFVFCQHADSIAVVICSNQSSNIVHPLQLSILSCSSQIACQLHFSLPLPPPPPNLSFPFNYYPLHLSPYFVS